MRSDMSKVITECYRLGGCDYKYNRRGKKHWDVENDDAPARESMRKWARVLQVDKEFGENLNPLYRFIASKVGEKWDDVYSEICKTLNPNNQVQNHILQHLYDVLEKDTYVGDDGHPYVHGYRGPDRVDVHRGYYGLRRNNLYVCPKDGTIKKTKFVPYVRKEQEIAHKIVSDKEILIKMDDVWYSCQVHSSIDRKALEKACQRYESGDALFLSVCYVPKNTTVAQKYRYVYERLVMGIELTPVEENFYLSMVKRPSMYTYKRQISTRELKRHGLK